MVSEPINSSLFHQLAEQLQQQNLEQFQKQLLEHQQKVVATTTSHKSVSSRDSALELVLEQLSTGVGLHCSDCSFFQAITIEGQDSLFGPENSVANSQNSSQPQLPEPASKLDDSIDNQQQVCRATFPEVSQCLYFRMSGFSPLLHSKPILTLRLRLY